MRISRYAIVYLPNYSQGQIHSLILRTHMVIAKRIKACSNMIQRQTIHGAMCEETQHFAAQKEKASSYSWRTID